MGNLPRAFSIFALRSSIFSPSFIFRSQNQALLQQARGIASKSVQGEGDIEAEYAAARKWASLLNKETIPKSLARVRFDRSSGKGGQHVNTTSSKATCSWSFNSIANHVPRILLPSLKTTNYYAPTSDTLVIQSQSSRSQHDNEEECHEKLFQLLRDVSKRVIPGETSREQKSKVEQLQKSENLARLKMKKQHADKKKARKGGNRGTDY